MLDALRSVSVTVGLPSSVSCMNSKPVTLRTKSSSLPEAIMRIVPE